MTFPGDEIEILVSKISKILILKNETLAISEAACGGLLSAYLVSIPGASKFYIGGKLVYSLKQRLKLSGWTEEDISSYMGPSEQVALKLARTTKYELGSTYVLSETGFAGPSTDLHLNSREEEEKGDEKDEEKGEEQEVEKEGEEKGAEKEEKKTELENGKSIDKTKVGIVYLGLNGPNGEVSCSRNTNSNDRSSNMTEFAKFGLQFLLENLEKAN